MVRTRSMGRRSHMSLPTGRPPFYRPNDIHKKHRLPDRHRKTQQVITYRRRKPLR